jgi:hypothetical protein
MQEQQHVNRAKIAGYAIGIVIVAVVIAFKFLVH